MAGEWGSLWQWINISGLLFLSFCLPRHKGSALCISQITMSVLHEIMLVLLDMTLFLIYFFWFVWTAPTEFPQLSIFLPLALSRSNNIKWSPGAVQIHFSLVFLIRLEEVWVVILGRWIGAERKYLTNKRQSWGRGGADRRSRRSRKHWKEVTVTAGMSGTQTSPGQSPGFDHHNLPRERTRQGINITRLRIREWATPNHRMGWEGP